MPELLLELLSEEIPARMQERAASELGERLGGELLRCQLRNFENLQTYVTPRRLVCVVQDLPEKQPDLTEEKRGPRVDAGAKAIEGFKRSLPDGAKIEEREEEKGRFLYATIQQGGRPAKEAIGEIVPLILSRFSWPKSMRWGTGEFQWVRPLRSILCILDGEVVPMEIAGLKSGKTTVGHRFLAPEPFEVDNFEEYKTKLRERYVVLNSWYERAQTIGNGAARLAEQAGLDLPYDEAMVAENAGLTEWPVPLLGRFDPAFLEVPEEVLISAMRGHQKYLTLRDPATARLAPNFICVANTEASDGGKAIVAGNERVLSARLSDARFFWQQDLKAPLEDRVAKLADIVFHDKLGTMAERVERIEALAVQIASFVRPPAVTPAKAGVQTSGAELDSGLRRNDEVEEGVFLAHVRRAARLAKADLVSGLVGEFPELQGTVGRRLAEAQGEPAAVACAIEEHYAPRGPDDACPSDPVSVCVALAEKLDTLVGFFAIDEKPTGSKDPFALRRAALGAIRLIVENGLKIKLLHLFDYIDDLHGNTWRKSTNRTSARISATKKPHGFDTRYLVGSIDLLSFIADRLKVQQRERGVRHDLIEAVFSLGGEDDLVRLLARVGALQRFVESAEGADLLAGYKRAGNILKIEGKKDGIEDRGAVDPALLVEPAEKALHERLGAAAGEARAALEAEDFADAMRALASLRAPIDAFFDAVTVNADAPDLRRNRLALLAQIRAAVHEVADFSKVEG